MDLKQVFQEEVLKCEAMEMNCDQGKETDALKQGSENQQC
jgi:hypothetical protein